MKFVITLSLFLILLNIELILSDKNQSGKRHLKFKSTKDDNTKIKTNTNPKNNNPKSKEQRLEERIKILEHHLKVESQKNQELINKLKSILFRYFRLCYK